MNKKGIIIVTIISVLCLAVGFLAGRTMSKRQIAKVYSSQFPPEVEKDIMEIYEFTKGTSVKELSEAIKLSKNQFIKDTDLMFFWMAFTANHFAQLKEDDRSSALDEMIDGKIQVFIDSYKDGMSLGTYQELGEDLYKKYSSEKNPDNNKK